MKRRDALKTIGTGLVAISCLPIVGLFTSDTSKTPIYPGDMHLVELIVRLKNGEIYNGYGAYLNLNVCRVGDKIWIGIKENRYISEIAEIVEMKPIYKYGYDVFCAEKGLTEKQVYELEKQRMII